ncbi:glutathione S-transferase family protein [Pleurocapsales cyanobacterium LEGE 06147]|nr:glutathione S-transferase family protein [Pleurocapsales cyanobacterium LEGE 06147]
MIKLYGHEVSGNSYKAQLLLSLLEIDYQYLSVDLRKGEHKSPEYLKLNPFGQVPVLIDGDIAIPDAQAILVYLARRYGNDRWLPKDPEAESRVIRWLSVTTGEIRQGLEAARLFYLFNDKSVDIEVAMQKSIFILQQLEQHLTNREWLELGHPTIADIAAFPYVVLAPDGRLSLANYPYICAWIERIRKLPGFVGMPGIEVTTAVAVN